MVLDETRKRKACISCTKAKAKCSPYGDRQDLCYRCQRLKKVCVFEESARKRAPKTRSRVRQLEDRVDTLIDLLTSKGQTSNGSEEPTSIDLPTTPSTDFLDPSPPEHSNSNASGVYITPVETPTCQGPKQPSAYDPVDAGLISPDLSEELLTEFRQFAYSFPFVIIPSSTDAQTLRHEQPFLFHSIMIIMSYKVPPTQTALANEFKNQIASRIISQSHKSLEILQGLLVYGAWYHYFYRHQSQQLAIVIQLCVAMVQDLGLSKNPKDKLRKNLTADIECGMVFKSERSSAEKRAFLGTYVLTVAFAQAWRKRGTMAYTRFMGQCCQSLSEGQEHPSDALITPLIRLSELIGRINDYYSYDDIDNSDVKGETMIEMSANNFSAELNRIRDAVPTTLKRNTTLSLTFHLLEMWIAECSLHSPLWQTLDQQTTFTPTRIRILNRLIMSLRCYIEILINASKPQLYQLAFPAWAGWFYAIIMACKVVFLQENERQGQTILEGVHQEIVNICPVNDAGLPRVSSTPSTNSQTLGWDPVIVAKENRIQALFEQLLQTIMFAFPPETPLDLAKCSDDNDPLFCIACVQLTILNGFVKRLNGYARKDGVTDRLYGEPSTDPLRSSTSTNTNPDTERQISSPGSKDAPVVNPIPFFENLNANFSSITFDSIALPTSFMTQNESYDDWMWNLMMDDLSCPISDHRS
ncbi:hypothetical protein BS50DRAFT_248067 [Corynespora cassiicola Philippines]|uniref:Zn(2)-C6 fungal-type domain-containing protein n=1 Tax=Corynespora cassiicola Philippines TaxID=1448308 RepID=A0A2T2P431_CORCC|nr:hypothetical protein BS50DRAFT_248067 [Corynespora cassiicola Philippines]